MTPVKLPSATPVLESLSVVLRPPRSDDKHARLALGRDAEYDRLVGDSPATGPLTPAEVDAWYDRLGNRPFGWVIEVDGRFAGDACLDHFNLQDRRARYAVGIFDPELRGRGVGTRTTRLVLGYGFDVLGLHRIDLRVLSYNAAAIAAYEKCGFVREGAERQSARVDGEWHDDLIMGILEGEYRTLSRYW